jgi:hypothetical protein
MIVPEFPYGSEFWTMTGRGKSHLLPTDMIADINIRINKERETGN